MKKNHIKTILLLLLLQVSLSASTYSWSSSVSKSEAYLNEALYLRFVCEFSNEAELYAVEFDPTRDDENATVIILSETSKIEDGKKSLVYEFLAFSHREGEVAFEFDTLMKKTTRDSIENTIIGRDNGKYAEYQTTKTKQKKLEVNILDSKTPFVGDVKIEFKHESEEVKALTPYHLQVKISGTANFEVLKPLAFEIEGVKVFSETPKQELELTKNGYKGTWSQKFAFVSEKDFTIKPFSIEYFDLVDKELKELSFDGVFVKVVEGYKKEDLLDKEEEYTFFFDVKYLYYLLAFIAGFLVAKIKFKRKTPAKENAFCTKVKNAKNFDELSVLLIMQNEEKYRQIILQIQNKELFKLEKAKKLICG